MLPLHLETKNSIPASSAVPSIRSFPTKRTANGKTSPREERANDSDGRDQVKPKVLGEERRVVLALPRDGEGKPHENAFEAGVTDRSGRDVSGKRPVGKAVVKRMAKEGGKGTRGPISPRIDIRSGHAAGHSRVRPLITKAPKFPTRGATRREASRRAAPIIPSAIRGRAKKEKKKREEKEERRWKRNKR